MEINKSETSGFGMDEIGFHHFGFDMLAAFDDLPFEIFFNHQACNRRSKTSTPAGILYIHSNGNFGLMSWSESKKYRVILAMRIF